MTVDPSVGGTTRRATKLCSNVLRLLEPLPQVGQRFQVAFRESGPVFSRWECAASYAGHRRLAQIGAYAVKVPQVTRRRHMSPMSREDKIQDFLAQKRIAVVGVSQNAAAHGTAGLIYRKLKRDGHEVFGINPNLPEFEGTPCYPDIASIPGGVDAVVIVTRPSITEAIVRQCGDAGVTRVWMHQSLARAGTSVSPAAVDFCQAHDIEVIAGACPMMYGPNVDFGHRCMRVLLGLTGGLPS